MVPQIYASQLLARSSPTWIARKGCDEMFKGPTSRDRMVAIAVALLLTLLGSPSPATAAPVREAVIDGYHEGPWARKRCTFTDCDQTSSRGSLAWGLSPTPRGVKLHSYSGGYVMVLRWLPSRGIYQGEENVGRWWRRSVELHVTKQKRIEGAWTATTLAGTTKTWSKGAPRYFETGRFTLHRRFGFGRLVFQSQQSLFMMDEDGTDLSPIDGICEGFEPSWRPSTQQIAFMHRCGPTGTFDVSVMGVDGNGLDELLATATDDFAPDWSHDGQQLALNSQETGDPEVYVVNADGGGLTNLTNDPASDLYPAFSPDDSEIVFTSDRNGNFDLYLMDVDGTNVRRLTYGSSDDGMGAARFGGGPVWSPNGHLIAFESDRSGSPEIYTLDLQGGKVSRLTTTKGSNVNPAFSPDGKRIAFASDRSGQFDIYTMGVHGQDLIHVSDRPLDDYQPDWVS